MSDPTDRFMLTNILLYYPNFFSFPVFDGEVRKAGARVLLDPSEPEHVAHLDSIKKRMGAICRENNKQNNGKMVPRDKRALREGADTNTPALQPFWTLSANCRKDTLPRVIHPFEPVDADGKANIIRSADEMLSLPGSPKFYSGCRASVMVRLWWQAPQPNQSARVNCELISAQWNGDGEPLDPNHISDEAAAEGYGAVAYDEATAGGGEWDEEPASAAEEDDNDGW